MRCLSSRTVGFKADGRTICWSEKERSKEYASFQLPCSKCIECRLEYARGWAVRCTQEAKMYENNSFITLTYSEQNLKSQKLNYQHFQNFMKDLRSHIHKTLLNDVGEARWQKLSKDAQKAIQELYAVPFKVTGEYGDQKKRPHWHALIFNWRPQDLREKYTNDNGDQIYASETLDKLWGHGITEVGQITFQSAGYVMRYAAKKLVHGNDQDHHYQPISKGSQRYAIGKKYLEKYYKDLFTRGHIILPNGARCSIPRYYEKWLSKQHPELWEAYVTKIKIPAMAKANQRELAETHKKWRTNDTRRAKGKGHQVEKHKVRKIIMDEKFTRLQKYLKGDI